jgi:hypothetical protein
MNLEKYIPLLKFCKNYTYEAIRNGGTLPTVISKGGRELPRFETEAWLVCFKKTVTFLYELIWR